MRRVEFEDGLTVITFVVVAIVLIVGAVMHHNAKVACEDQGGRYVAYDCETTWVLSSCGSDCTMLVPVESCEYRCELAENPNQGHPLP
jgi:hypothetical protein